MIEGAKDGYAYGLCETTGDRVVEPDRPAGTTGPGLHRLELPLTAVDAATGTVDWQAASVPAYAATSYTNGVVFAPETGLPLLIAGIRLGGARNASTGVQPSKPEPSRGVRPAGNRQPCGNFGTTALDAASRRRPAL